MGPEDITVTLAVVAGLLSFISPCVLPLMPVYIGYLTGVAVGDTRRGERLRVFVHALLFIGGFTLIFVLIGVTTGFVFGTFIQATFADVLVKVGGVLLVVLGIYMSGTLRWTAAGVNGLPALQRGILWVESRLGALILPERRLSAGGGAAPGLVRSGVVGMSFAAGWAPCIGPLLGGILTLAANAAYAGDPVGAVLTSSRLLFAYSLGLAIPFLVTAVLLGRATRLLRAINRHGHIVETVSGVFLIGVGLLVLFGALSDLNRYFSATPDWLYELETKLLE